MVPFRRSAEVRVTDVLLDRLRTTTSDKNPLRGLQGTAGVVGSDARGRVRRRCRLTVRQAHVERPVPFKLN